MKESHPYLRYFDPSRKWRFLVIGTFPPNKEVREEKKAFVDYFYGNKGSFWSIIDAIYPDYYFKECEKENRIKIIQKWQNDYSVGITDTIAQCERKTQKSFSDNDLVFTHSDLNHSLKDYILDNLEVIDKIYFTSSEGVNSALSTFKMLLGPDIFLIPKSKMVTDLISPSNAVNQSIFHRANDLTLGLEGGFYEFITSTRKDLISFYNDRWQLKKKKFRLPVSQRENITLPKSQKGIVAEYKIWSYRRFLPQTKLTNEKN